MSATASTAILNKATMRDAVRIVGCGEPSSHQTLRCPFHEDPNPSLKLVGPKGIETGWRCFGCGKRGGIFDFLVEARVAADHAHAAEILEARLGESTPAAALESPPEPAEPRRSGVPAEPRRSVVAQFTYVDEHGNAVGRVDRLEPGRGGRAKDFVQYRREGDAFIPGLAGSSLPLYRLDEVLAVASAHGKLFFCEGEGKSDRLRDALIASKSNAAVTSIAGGAKAPLRPGHIGSLSGFEQIILLSDSDEPGRLSARIRAGAIARAHPGCDVRIVDLYPDRSDGLDIENWLEDGHSLRELRALVDAATIVPAVAAEGPKGSAAGVLTFDDLAKRSTEHVDWFIEGLIRRSGILLIASQPKVGKSDTARNLAKAVASGTEFLGRRCQKGRVLWIGLEEPIQHLHERIEIMQMQTLDIVYVIEQPEGDESSWLRSVVENHSPALVIIDTIGRFSNIENVNDYSQVKRATQPILDLRSRYGTTFVLLHHNNHANKTLGSTMWEGAVDTIMSLTRNTDGARFVQTKQRSGIDLEPTILAMNHDTGTITCDTPAWIADQRAAEKRILTYLQTVPNATREELAANCGRRAGTGRAAVDTLTAAGLIRRAGNGTKSSPRVYSAIRRSADENTPGKNIGSIYVEESGESGASGRGITRGKTRNSGEPGSPGKPGESGAEQNLVDSGSR